MTKEKKSTIHVQGSAITILRQKEDDFICLTDMAKKFGGDDLIHNWMRNRNTLEFLGIWEQIHNPDFKGVEFDTFKKEAGLNSFRLTPKKWVEATKAIGIQSRAGRFGGGTYAHKDLAFEFGSWLSPEFKLYLIKEFQSLKEDENRRLSLEWNLNRTLRDLSKVLEYSEYRHFKPVIDRAKDACKNSGYEVSDHFEDILDMIDLGKGAKRGIDDVKLSRYACYLIVQNADPGKEIVALGQTYFAVQTRLQEIQQIQAGLPSLFKIRR